MTPTAGGDKKWLKKACRLLRKRFRTSTLYAGGYISGGISTHAGPIIISAESKIGFLFSLMSSCYMVMVTVEYMTQKFGQCRDADTPYTINANMKVWGYKAERKPTVMKVKRHLISFTLLDGGKRSCELLTFTAGGFPGFGAKKLSMAKGRRIRGTLELWPRLQCCRAGRRRKGR